jgi:hypothetical protein
MDGGVEKNKAVEVLKNFRKAESSESVDREIWKKTFQYVNNRVDGQLGQWPEGVRAELGPRPALSLPFIGPIVNRISGAQRATKIDEKVFPRDDQADPIVADVLTDLLKHVYELPENRTEWQIAKMFRNGVICGRGWLKVEFTDEFDPFGDISIRSVHPRRVYLIGRGDRYDLLDRPGIIEKIPMSKDELKAAYPEKFDDIISQKEATEIAVPMAGEDYDFTVESGDFWDEEEKEYFILRQQTWEWKSMRFLKNPETGELIPVDDGVKDLPVKPVTKKVRKVRIITVCGDVLLQDEISEYKHGRFDLVPFFPYFDDGITRGVAQDLLDIQDERNKRRSQITHILGVTAKGNYFVKKGALDDGNDFDKRIGGTGQRIEVNTTGSISDSIQPVRPDLTLLPALIGLEQNTGQEARETSGLSETALGSAPPSVKSGVAIQALQMPTETIIGEMVENYLETRKMLASMVISLIQQFYTREKRVRVLGDYTRGFVPAEVQDMYERLKADIQAMNPLYDEAMAGEMAAQMIDIQNGAKIVTVNKQIGEKKLLDVTAGRFDVTVDHVSQNPTTRRGLLFDLLNLRAMGIPVPNATLIEYSDIRNKRKVIADMQNEEQALMQKAVAEEMQKSMGRMSNPTQHDQLQNVAGGQLPMM